MLTLRFSPPQTLFAGMNFQLAFTVNSAIHRVLLLRWAIQSLSDFPPPPHTGISSFFFFAAVADARLAPAPPPRL
jgi:hypothetical protein